jgi:ABC-type phosphate/phosphonate transport system substrate-binding protein/rhodanese-related sulfurtransferase
MPYLGVDNMRKVLFLAFTVAGIAAGSAATAAQPLKVSVSGEPREEISTAAFMERYGTLAKYVGVATGADIRLSYGRDLTRELQRTRSRAYDLMIGPAHVIGSAIRYGYEPVARFEGEERAVFIASEASKVTSFQEARGKRLALPPADSLATYLARGELNARGVQAKSYFGQIRLFRFHEAALLALEFGQADVAVADRRLAEEWLARNKGRILVETQAAPMTGVAVLSTLDQATKERVRSALLKPNAKTVAAVDFAGTDVQRMRPTFAKEYDYVSTLGYFTPRVLAGVKIVSAEEVMELMKKGASLYDTRSEEEYRDKHIKGAKWLPYNEKSAKEVDFDFAKDAFDVVRASNNKDAPVIFACNGAECWKSYKSCIAAVKAGYKQVYWFRGGFPEWVARGYAVDTLPATAALTR